MALTDEDRAEIAQMPDGVRGWITVPVVTDGGSLRIGSGDGEQVDTEQADDLVWDGTTLPSR